MKMQIKPVEIEDNPLNKVTSTKVFKSRKIIDAKGNYLFDPDGIFSERIFGKYNKCTCGALTKPGICTKCNCRVLSKRKMPNFYTEFDFDLPRQFIDFSMYEDGKILKKLVNYEGFLYDDEYVDFSVKNDNSGYDPSKVMFGKEAILSLGIDEETYESWVYRKVTIPHTSFRKITFRDNKYFLGDINNIYINIIRKNNLYNRFQEHNTIDPFYELNLKQYVSLELKKLYNNLYQILAKNHKNIIANELRGQPETGVIRAVMTNNFGLEEDDILIGSYFISTLYPTLYKEYTSDGVTDIDAINEILKEDEYLVLFNRQPTIGQKSIIAMRPKFSKIDAEKYVIQANPIIYDGLAADVDGDTLNVIALYTKEACEEAKKLLPSKNYIEGSNETIRNKLPEDFEYVKSRLT